MEELEIKLYAAVYKRDVSKMIPLKDFLFQPESVYYAFDKLDAPEKLESISQIEDKIDRNQAKRDYMMAVDLSPAKVLAIDIDNIAQISGCVEFVVEKLSALPSCFAIKKSISGNVFALFRWDCDEGMFQFLYYQLWLELTMLLKLNIDFLPELGRLRYVSLGEPLYYNADAVVLSEYIELDSLPYINTAVKQEPEFELVPDEDFPEIMVKRKVKRKKVIYGSN